MAAEYFHVVTYEATGRRHLILSDLSEQDLKARFLRPRSRGAKEVVGDRVFDFGTLDQVTIVRTTSPKVEVLAAYDRLRNKGADEFNSEDDEGGGLHWIPMPISEDDIVDAGEDVTSRYIKDAPGGALRQWEWTHNPWTVGFIVTVVGGTQISSCKGRRGRPGGSSAASSPARKPPLRR